MKSIVLKVFSISEDVLKGSNLHCMYSMARTCFIYSYSRSIVQERTVVCQDTEVPCDRGQHQGNTGMLSRPTDTGRLQYTQCLAEYFEALIVDSIGILVM